MTLRAITLIKSRFSTVPPCELDLAEYPSFPVSRQRTPNLHPVLREALKDYGKEAVLRLNGVLFARAFVSHTSQYPCKIDVEIGGGLAHKYNAAPQLRDVIHQHMIQSMLRDMMESHLRSLPPNDTLEEAQQQVENVQNFLMEVVGDIGESLNRPGLSFTFFFLTILEHDAFEGALATVRRDTLPEGWENIVLIGKTVLWQKMKASHSRTVQVYERQLAAQRRGQPQKSLVKTLVACSP
ncbi:hypothetical protein L202_08282 [Cryptococcus amylolentus CBS 6039]|uniref:Uncharacterized protein n=2 Tax=Cryptococcus amylolentus TaxID=104669 RepID=A0A1E3H969_9TREE|nr:hypothetical protein L202_08282 [Cryptococcus amylolentus CBS 6039]ODN72853.1 hypothetical protein L202_08282 [Cryptococcus amylolentus CBS 6039]ODN98043.1 hypothetical protein I350_07685 [Cryptococcus amylolentus CBS 6273]